jgi:hypothetical protein
MKIDLIFVRGFSEAKLCVYKFIYLGDWRSS